VQPFSPARGASARPACRAAVSRTRYPGEPQQARPCYKPLGKGAEMG